MRILPQKSFWFVLFSIVFLLSSCTKSVQTNENFVQSDLHLSSSLSDIESEHKPWLNELLSQHLKNSQSAQLGEYKNKTDSQPIIMIIPGALSIRADEELSLKIHRGGSIDTSLIVELTADSSNFSRSVTVEANQWQSEDILILPNTFSGSNLVKFTATSEGYTQGEVSVYIFETSTSP